MHIVVETEARLLHAVGLTVPCEIGRNGACEAIDKREGDGRTPLGIWPIRAALLRPGTDLITPPRLPWRWLRPDDGWSDDSADPAYNRPVRHPHAFSAERLWRDDPVYDGVIVLGHNDAPPAPGMGSAIFLHLLGERPTEGCVAIGRDMMGQLLQRLMLGSMLEIRRQLGDAMPLV